jgi:ketosteroid isomerase-like protein
VTGDEMQRTIDVPISGLPAINEISVEIDADAIRTWEALIATTPRLFDTRRARRVSPLLGAAQTEAKGDPSVIGSTLPGFIVARSVRPALLALLGQHRFSRYALLFAIDDIGHGRSRLTAETRAEYPGRSGTLFHSLLVRSRGQLTGVNRILEAVKKRAEGAMATLDRNQLALWIAAYEAAWRSEGTEALPRLFSPEASYSTGPYKRPHLGIESISKMWEAERSSHEETFKLHSEILAVEGDTGIVRVAVHYEEPRQQEYRNLWVIRLDEEGRCVHFEEWPFWPEDSGGAVAESPEEW